MDGKSEYLEELDILRPEPDPDLDADVSSGFDVVGEVSRLFRPVLSKSMLSCSGEGSGVIFSVVRLRLL